MYSHNMKNALILHGTANNHTGNWFPWLTEELQTRGWKVFCPDLPHAERPNIKRYTKYITDNWMFDSESVIIGHSSGAVEILGLLSQFPKDLVISQAILVSGFTDNLGDAKSELFLEPFDYEYIQKKAKRFVIFHSDTDPYVPLYHGEKLASYLGGELVILKDQGHFNLEKGPQYKQFPLLLEKIIG